jgi:hypothetical protein
MRRRSYLREILRWTIVILGVSFFSFPSSAQTDEQIARAVRHARQMHGATLSPLQTASIFNRKEMIIVDRLATARQILGAGLPRSDVPDDLDLRIADEDAKQTAQELLFGLKFGAGVSLVSSLGRKHAIREAELDANKIVRIKAEDTSSVGYLLEAHYFVTPNYSFLGIDNITAGKWGIGPFVAVQAGSDKSLTGIGFGLMLGFKQLSTIPPPVAGLSWNIGVGALYDPSVKVLGAGITANQPLPAGETTIRTTEVGGWGLMVMSSFNF